MGGSSGSSTPAPVVTQTTQNRDPWSSAQPYMQTAMSAADDYFRRGVGYLPFPDSTVAAQSPLLTEGLGQQEQLARSTYGGTPGVLAGQKLGLEMIKNEGLNSGLLSLLQQAQGNENPYLQKMLDTSNRRIADKVNSGVSGAGRYGSGAHTDIASRAMAEAADPILAQDYARRQQQQQDILSGGLQRAGTWSTVMPMLDAAQYAPAERAALLGQLQTDRAQADINEAIKRWNTTQAKPWEDVQRLNAIASGAGGLGSTTMGTSTQPGAAPPSTLQRLFGGAAAGAGIGSMFGPGIGTGVGAIGGGLLGLL